MSFVSMWRTALSVGLWCTGGLLCHSSDAVWRGLKAVYYGLNTLYYGFKVLCYGFNVVGLGHRAWLGGAAVLLDFVTYWLQTY